MNSVQTFGTVVLLLVASCGSRTTLPATTQSAATASGRPAWSAAPSAVVSASETICTSVTGQFGRTATLQRSETVPASVALDWERYRSFEAGVIVVQPQLANLSPLEQVTICEFRSSELSPPLPPGAEQPDTLIISVTPGGEIHQEIVGPKANIRDPFPSDFARVGYKPSQTSTTPQASELVTIQASDKSEYELGVAFVDGGFCYGLPDPVACRQTASLESDGPVLAQEFPEERVLLCFVRADVGNMLIDLTDGTTVSQVVFHRRPESGRQARYSCSTAAERKRNWCARLRCEGTANSLESSIGCHRDFASTRRCRSVTTAVRQSIVDGREL